MSLEAKTTFRHNKKIKQPISCLSLNVSSKFGHDYCLDEVKQGQQQTILLLATFN